MAQQKSCCHATERLRVPMLETTYCVKNKVRLAYNTPNGRTPSLVHRAAFFTVQNNGEIKADVIIEF